MTYRMESAKPAPKHTWGYSIDYDKAISEDEARVAYLTSEAVVRMAALVEANPWLWNMNPLRGVEDMPALRDAFGLTEAQMRGWVADMSVIDARGAEWQDGLTEKFGAAQAGDVEAWRACAFDPDFRLFGETDYTDSRGQVRAGRKTQLKKAKASLSRHKRNKEKFG